MMNGKLIMRLARLLLLEQLLTYDVVDGVAAVVDRRSVHAAYQPLVLLMLLLQVVDRVRSFGKSSVSSTV